MVAVAHINCIRVHTIIFWHIILCPHHQSFNVFFYTFVTFGKNVSPKTYLLFIRRTASNETSKEMWFLFPWMHNFQMIDIHRVHFRGGGNPQLFFFLGGGGNPKILGEYKKPFIIAFVISMCKHLKNWLQKIVVYIYCYCPMPSVYVHPLFTIYRN
jgi:hypothetical protein